MVFLQEEYSRHHVVNEILARSLRSIDMSAVLELPGLMRGDGKRPLYEACSLVCRKIIGLGFHLSGYAGPFALTKNYFSSGGSCIGGGGSKVLKVCRYQPCHAAFLRRQSMCRKLQGMPTIGAKVTKLLTPTPPQDAHRSSIVWTYWPLRAYEILQFLAGVVQIVQRQAKSQNIQDCYTRTDLHRWQHPGEVWVQKLGCLGTDRRHSLQFSKGLSTRSS